MSSPKYSHVNAYAVDRVYGGPEEGGWWYDTGTFLGGRAVLQGDDEEAYETTIEAAKKYLHERFAHEYEGNRSRYSVIGEENFEVYVEDEPGADFPQERPHYE
jgi:hypothetical protein